MVHIFRGEPPKKPIFSITRGYTQELWDMSTFCWDLDPTKRPTVEHVLHTLIIAAEQWKQKHGGLSTQDDSEEESDSPTVESEDEPVDDTSSSLDPPQPLVTETPIPAPPSASPPSIVKDPAQPEITSITPEKEEMRFALAVRSMKISRL